MTTLSGEVKKADGKSAEGVLKVVVHREFGVSLKVTHAMRGNTGLRVDEKVQVVWITESGVPFIYSSELDGAPMQCPIVAVLKETIDDDSVADAITCVALSPNVELIMVDDDHLQAFLWRSVNPLDGNGYVVSEELNWQSERASWF